MVPPVVAVPMLICNCVARMVLAGAALHPERGLRAGGVLLGGAGGVLPGGVCVGSRWWRAAGQRLCRLLAQRRATASTTSLRYAMAMAGCTRLDVSTRLPPLLPLCSASG